MNTFPCHYGFAALWTFGCVCVGWLISFWVLSMCRSASRGDQCAECLRRRAEVERERNAEHAASAVIQDEMKPLPILSDCCGVAVTEFNGRLICPHCLKPASQTITPPARAIPEEANEVARPAGSIYPRTITSGPLAGAILDSPAPGSIASPDVKPPGKLTPRMGA